MKEGMRSHICEVISLESMSFYQKGPYCDILYLHVYGFHETTSTHPHLSYHFIPPTPPP